MQERLGSMEEKLVENKKKASPRHRLAVSAAS
jgi:hypothetical protein